MKFIFFICDDDAGFCHHLETETKSILDNSEYEYELTTFSDPLKMLEYAKSHKVDIVLSDIEMPALSGFELIHRLNDIDSDIRVLFVTAHENMAYQAFEHHPYSFIHKAEIDTRFSKELLGLLQKLEHIRQKNFNFKDRKFIVDFDKTLYFTTKKNYVIAHYSSEKEESFRITIKELYKNLKPHGFILVKVGCIVNCRFIEIMDSKEIVLKDGTVINMTTDKKRADEAIDLFFKFKMGRVFL